ncbi:MAG: hypothetical protein JST00_04095 [Deltaproteobacteria bacterium]|nr:hypothetical protein [Deltaproteobacteria bacterium]
MRRAFGAAVMAFLSLAGLAGCHKSKKYDANVEVTRISVVRRDENGRALTTDFEFSYFECPGTQIETIRGGEEFSACVSKLAVGAKVPVKIEHHWDPEGHMVWEVYQVGDCKRPPDPNDEASYAMVRECNDWKVNGATVGFECQIAPKKELLQKCPWFSKH